MRHRDLTFLFSGTIAVSCIPLGILTVQALFSSTSPDEESWLNGLIFFAFGFSISAIQNGIKLLGKQRDTTREEDKTATLFLLIMILLTFVVILPVASVFVDINGTPLGTIHFAAIVAINIVLLWCAYMIDVVCSLPSRGRP